MRVLILVSVAMLAHAAAAAGEVGRDATVRGGRTMSAPKGFASPVTRPTRAYEGIWGGDGSAACRDEDGVDRMLIEGNLLAWYETRCKAHKVKAEGARTWTMHLSCEGEGKRYRARPRLSLAKANKLIIDDAPVGPTKRQVYVRCSSRR
jgi:hypothetical protein